MTGLTAGIKISREDPVEAMVAKTLNRHNVYYTRGNHSQRLDFHLPVFGVYIECKRYHTDRIEEQTKGMTNVIIIQGMEAARAFDDLLTYVAIRAEEAS